MKLKELLPLIEQYNDIIIYGDIEEDYYDYDGETNTRYYYGVVYSGKVRLIKKDKISEYLNKDVTYIDIESGIVKTEQQYAEIGDEEYL